MKQLLILAAACLLAACDRGGSERTRTGASDVEVTDAMLDCLMKNDPQLALNFLATPSGTTEEEEQFRPVTRALSKHCSDNAIVHVDIVDLRYRLKARIN